MNIFKLFFKKLMVPVTNQTKEVQSVKLWLVRWKSRNGSYPQDYQNEVEAFTSKEEAEYFRQSLVSAFKLIRCTHQDTVEIINPK